MDREIKTPRDALAREVKRIPHEPIKGRGTQYNPDNRFSNTTSTPVDDGWHREEARGRVPTTLIEERAKTIISSNRSPDIPFNYSINPYRGCEHGCIYCYARPSHAYWDFSAGLDFETKIIVKTGAAGLLRETLSKPGYRCETLCIGANTDPYQPAEASLKITRSILEVLREHRHPFSIITKSQLIGRDIDILAEMAKLKLCSVAISVTTMDNHLKRILEPRASSGDARLAIIKKLSDAGIRVTMLVAPVIPLINDAELESILAAGKRAGAISARYIFLRLPGEVAGLFRTWLEEHYPDRAAHVMSLVQQSRAGKDYESEFGKRMVGRGVFAEMLNQRFHVNERKLGFIEAERFSLDNSQFRRPGASQMQLF